MFQRVLQVMEKSYPNFVLDSTRALYIDALQKLRKSHSLREDERRAIFDFLDKVTRNSVAKQEDNRFLP